MCHVHDGDITTQPRGGVIDILRCCPLPQFTFEYCRYTTFVLPTQKPDRLRVRPSGESDDNDSCDVYGVTVNGELADCGVIAPAGYRSGVRRRSSLARNTWPMATNTATQPARHIVTMVNSGASTHRLNKMKCRRNRDETAKNVDSDNAHSDISASNTFANSVGRASTDVGCVGERASDRMSS